MSRKHCGDKRRDSHGREVATCRLAPHLDPEHADAASGHRWFNGKQEDAYAFRRILAMRLELQARAGREEK